MAPVHLLQKRWRLQFESHVHPAAWALRLRSLPRLKKVERITDTHQWMRGILPHCVQWGAEEMTAVSTPLGQGKGRLLQGNCSGVH